MVPRGRWGPDQPRDDMTSDPHFGIALERRLIYQPVIVEPREGGFSSEEVNALLLGVEREFEAYLRQTEDRISELTATLSQREEELTRIANLADDRARQDAARLADHERASRDALENLQAALDAARRETEGRKSDIATLEDALASMRRSTSWRITGPLRRIVRLLRRR